MVLDEIIGLNLFQRSQINTFNSVLENQITDLLNKLVDVMPKRLQPLLSSIRFFFLEENQSLIRLLRNLIHKIQIRQGTYNVGSVEFLLVVAVLEYIEMYGKSSANLLAIRVLDPFVEETVRQFDQFSHEEMEEHINLIQQRTSALSQG